MYKNLYSYEKDNLLYKLKFLKFIKTYNTSQYLFNFSIYFFNKINSYREFKEFKDILIYIEKLKQILGSTKIKLLIESLCSLNLNISSLLKSFKILLDILTVKNKYSLKTLLPLVKTNNVDKLNNILNSIIFQNKILKYNLKKSDKIKINKLIHYLKDKKYGYEIFPVLEQCIELLNKPLYFKYKSFFWNMIYTVVDDHYAITDFCTMLKSICYIEKLGFFKTSKELFTFLNNHINGNFSYYNNLPDLTYDLFESNESYYTIYPVTVESAFENGYMHLFEYFVDDMEDDDNDKYDYDLAMDYTELKISHPILVKYLNSNLSQQKIEILTKKVAEMYEDNYEIIISKNFDGICLVGETIDLFSNDFFKEFYELLLYCKKELNK